MRVCAPSALGERQCKQVYPSEDPTGRNDLGFHEFMRDIEAGRILLFVGHHRKASDTELGDLEQAAASYDVTSQQFDRRPVRLTVFMPSTRASLSSVGTDLWNTLRTAPKS